MSELLRSVSLRSAMLAFALRRGAGADAEDAVQAALADAWQQANRPDEPESLRRWLWGILRHKVVDLHRKRSREIVAGDLESPESDDPGAHVQRRGLSRSKTEGDGLAQTHAEELLRWASRNLPEGKDTEQTLEWLLREADGESLDHIAHEAALPAARVRKRVSRLREHFRSHWQRDVAALAALGIVLGVVIRLWPSPPTPEPIARDPQPTAPDPRHLRSLELRERAHDACEQAQWSHCLELLDEALGLGEPEAPRDAADRIRAVEQSQPKLPPAPSSTPTPTPTPTPKSTPTPTPKSSPPAKPTAPSPPSGGSW